LTLDKKEIEALDKILDMLMPSSISGFFSIFYNKEALKRALIDGAAKDPLMSIKIRNIFTVLKQVFE